jgi:signal transduction histidine kinase
VRLTPRRRAFLAVLVSWPLGFVYLFLAIHLVINLARHSRGAFISCGSGPALYVDEFNGCNGTSFHGGYVWFELVAMSVVAVAAAYGLARWVAWPMREIADTIARFGPTSLGLRLRAAGPPDETRRLSDEIDAMLDRLAEGYEAQRRFASNASHELRTPLATQRALIEVSLSSALTPEQLQLLSRQLLATNERNEQLVDGLLTLAETERGLMANTPLRLDVIVGEAVETLRQSAKEREVEIHTTLEPVTVIGERPLLERLASNLIFNAVKYNHAGGSVTVHVDRAGGLTVANTGPVVPPEQVPGLFEPFRRASGERLDHGGGVGLGLTIARSIVAAHGAAIEAHANPAGGLTVAVRLRPA